MSNIKYSNIQNMTRGLELKPYEDILTWPDLSWPDLNWPNLSSPDLARSDLAWPDIPWPLTKNISKKTFRQISHSKLEISLHLSNISKEVSQPTDWQTYTIFKIIWIKCKNTTGISPKYFRKLSHPELDISLDLPYFSKGVSQLTDWQTHSQFIILLK